MIGVKIATFVQAQWMFFFWPAMFLTRAVTVGDESREEQL